MAKAKKRTAPRGGWKSERIPDALNENIDRVSLQAKTVTFGETSSARPVIQKQMSLIREISFSLFPRSG
jgi:hypothetical protein